MTQDQIRDYIKTLNDRIMRVDQTRMLAQENEEDILVWKCIAQIAALEEVVKELELFLEGAS